MAPHAAIAVWPVSPDVRGPKRNVCADVDALPFIGWQTLRLAAAEIARQPVAVAKAFALLVRDPSPRRVRLKNVAVFPKALALAQRARAEGIEHIHAYWLSTPATVALVVSRLTGIPWSATAHRWDIYEGNMIPAKLSAARFVRTISERGRSDLALRAPDFASRLRTVRIGVRLPERAATPAFRPNALHLLCAANLVPVKGHRFVIHAIARARSMGIEVSATFAGDGPLRAELQQLARRLRVDDVIRFRKNVPHDRLIGELARGIYDAAILASIEEPGGLMEGVPVASIEAMAQGLPCIASDSGSIGELVDDECGIVVPHSDPMRLSLAIAALAASPERRRILGERARSRIAESFERTACAAELIRMIERTTMWDSVACRVSNEASCAS